MRTFVVAAATMLVLLLHVGQALPADEPPTNVGVFMPGFNADPRTGSLFGGPVPAGRAFVMRLDVSRHLLPGQGDTEEVSTTGNRTATYEVDLAAGLELQPSAQVLVGSETVVTSACTTGCLANLPEGQFATSTWLRLVAHAAGTYTVAVRITATSHPDPDAGNNEFTKEITVAVPAAQVTAGRVVATPTTPRAGRPYSLALPLTRAGADVTPASVRCTAKVGSRRLAGTSARLPGRARCTWRIPRGTVGRTLRAKLVASAGGRAFSASRTARVR
jgi:hypothetical protein